MVQQLKMHLLLCAAFPQVLDTDADTASVIWNFCYLKRHLFFSSDRIKNICGDLNSPTSPVYPQHFANAPNTLNYLLAPTACVAGPRWIERGRLLQSGDRILPCLKHFLAGSLRRGRKPSPAFSCVTYGSCHPLAAMGRGNTPSPGPHLLQHRLQ